jgi:hypothetical protein
VGGSTALTERAILYEVDVFAMRGRWRSDIPGALAILCAIAFGTGVIDRDVRADLPGLLWGSLPLGVALGALALWARRAIATRLRAFTDGHVGLAGPAGVEELRGPLAISYGRARELISAGASHRVVPVLWVSARAADGRAVVLRRAMGILDALPDAWPELPPPAAARTFSSLALDPPRLLEALTRPPA